MPRIKLYLVLGLSVNFCLGCFVYASDIDRLFEHYKYFHQNPELSLHEENTSAYMALQLETFGYEVETGLGGFGLVGKLNNGEGPTIMFRADMDALPIEEKTNLPFRSMVKSGNKAGEEIYVMHACGHDIHMTVLLGIARNMAIDKAKWKGTLLLIAEPAEEIGAGSKAMIVDGIHKKYPIPDYNLGYHVSPDLPAGNIGYVSGYSMANVDSVDITIFGVGGHGAFPQKTKDPIVIAAHIVLALQTIISRELSPIDTAVVTVGSIHGGTKHNIIPDKVKLQLTVRSYADETRDFLLRRIKEISQGVAKTAGIPDNMLPVVTIKDEYTPSVYNSPELIDRVVPVLKSALGQSAVHAVDPVMIGDDFSRYGRTKDKIPSALLWLGAVNEVQYENARKSGEALPGLHSAYFAPDAKPTIEKGVKAMSAVILELFREH